jgi:hypothetical protein
MEVVTKNNTGKLGKIYAKLLILSHFWPKHFDIPSVFVVEILKAKMRTLPEKDLDKIHDIIYKSIDGVSESAVEYLIQKQKRFSYNHKDWFEWFCGIVGYWLKKPNIKEIPAEILKEKEGFIEILEFIIGRYLAYKLCIGQINKEEYEKLEKELKNYVKNKDYQKVIKNLEDFEVEFMFKTLAKDIVEIIELLN